MPFTKVFVFMNLFLVSHLSSAKTAYFNDLQGRAQGSYSFECQTCHGTTNPKSLNSFGQLYRDIFRKNITDAVWSNYTIDEKWQYFLDQDADADTITNRDEITNDTNPGVKD